MYSFLSEVTLLVLNCITAFYLLFEAGAASSALGEKDGEYIATFHSTKWFIQWIMVATLVILILFCATLYVFFAIGSALQSLSGGILAGALAIKCFFHGKASCRMLMRRRPPV